MSEKDPFVVMIAVTKPIVVSAVRRYLRTSGDVDVEDAVQDVYLTLYTRWRAGKLAHLESPDAYVYTVAKNTCLNKNRRRDTLNLEDFSEPHVDVKEGLSPEDRLVLGKAMASVPEKYRLVLQLVLSGYTSSDLVTGLKMPLNTIKSLVLRGKQKLKKALEKEGYNDYSQSK